MKKEWRVNKEKKEQSIENKEQRKQKKQSLKKDQGMENE